MDEKKVMQYEEVQARKQSGILFLIIICLMFLIGAALFVVGVIKADSGENLVLATTLWVVGAILACVIAPILCCGLKIVRPNEALVFTLFGNYFGTLREPGFFFVNPFVSALNPAKNVDLSDVHDLETKNGASKPRPSKTISLKAMTLSNGKQKINDELGNPIIIGIVVVWRVENTAKAVFNVDNFKDYLAMQCDSALRDIVRIYPYDAPDNSDGEKSLRGSSKEIAQKLKEEIQAKVDIAGLEIIEARITHLSYAEEIAAAMLQRQQASAIIDARQMIVEGAVGMVKMALEQLAVDDIVELDEERKAAMVSNLLVVLCGNKDPQPIVNSGSIY